MRIVCNSSLSNDALVLTDDGKDLKEELNITEITIKFASSEEVTVTIKCISDSININSINKLIITDDKNTIHMEGSQK